MNAGINCIFEEFHPEVKCNYKKTCAYFIIDKIKHNTFLGLIGLSF